MPEWSTQFASAGISPFQGSADFWFRYPGLANILHLRRKSLFDLNSGGIDQEFCPDPALDAMQAPDPCGQRRETPSEAGAVAKPAFDFSAHREQLLSKVAT
jgi:hypothetical protein